MRVAHLILTHKNPPQLERLLAMLAHPSFDFYIHIDKKADITPFLPLAEKKNVFLVRQRVSIHWAGYGTIQATLNSFEEILAKGGYDYINVMSGQDFPLKSADYIHEYIAQRKGTEFISCESIEDEWKSAAGRIKQYHLINWRLPGKFRLEKWINRILPTRKYPLDHIVVGRANWFTITHGAAQYIIDFLKKNPKVVGYFKYCWGADEFIFSTVVYNSPYREKIRPNLMYVDWTGQVDGHPRVLNISDFDRLTTTRDKLLARKFDLNTDSAIVDQLEKWIKEQYPISSSSPST